VKEKFGLKYPVGQTGNKQDKYVESAKGTNLFFNVYWNEKKKQRVFETVSLQDVVLHQMSVAHLPKKNRLPVPINSEMGEFLFFLSPNDLVYVPTLDQNETLSVLDIKYGNIYKAVSFTGGKALFVPQYVSTIIKDGLEFQKLNKMQVDINEKMVKKVCWKLEIDKLGQIKNIIKAPAELSEYSNEK